MQWHNIKQETTATPNLLLQGYKWRSGCDSRWPWSWRGWQSYKSHPQPQVQADTSSHRSSQVLDGSPNNTDLKQFSRRRRGGRLPWHFQEPAVYAPIVILGHTGVMSSALCRDSTRTRTWAQPDQRNNNNQSQTRTNMIMYTMRLKSHCIKKSRSTRVVFAWWMSWIFYA